MTCRDWEERIASAARDGDPDASLYQHLACCARCLRFAGQMAIAAEALARWDAPVPEDASAAVTRSALVERLAAVRQPPSEHSRQRSAHRIAGHPSLVAVAGAAAIAVATTMSPGWVQWAVGCWASLAALAVSLVLLHQGRPDTTEGEI